MEGAVYLSPDAAVVFEGEVEQRATAVVIGGLEDSGTKGAHSSRTVKHERMRGDRVCEKSMRDRWFLECD